MLNRGQSKSKVYQKTGRLFTKLFEYIEDLGNDQLAAFDCDLKRSTSLASIPNIALKTKQFYSRSVLFNFMTFYSIIMTFELLKDVNKTSIVALKFIILHFK